MILTPSPRKASVSAYLLLSVMLTGAGVYGSIPLLFAQTSSRWEAVSSIAVLLTVLANLLYQYVAKRDADKKAEEAKVEAARVANASADAAIEAARARASIAAKAAEEAAIVATKLEAVHKEAELVRHATDGMKDELVRVTRQAAFLQGEKEGAVTEKGKQKDVAQLVETVAEKVAEKVVAATDKSKEEKPCL